MGHLRERAEMAAAAATRFLIQFVADAHGQSLILLLLFHISRLMMMMMMAFCLVVMRWSRWAERKCCCCWCCSRLAISFQHLWSIDEREQRGERARERKKVTEGSASCNRLLMSFRHCTFNLLWWCQFFQFSSVQFWFNVERVMHVINVEDTLGDEDWTGLAAAVAAWMASVFLSPAQKLFAGLFTW